MHVKAPLNTKVTVYTRPWCTEGDLKKRVYTSLTPKGLKTAILLNEDLK